jgi:hypothetical protein
MYACIAPSGLDRPIQGAVSKTSVELYWMEPYDDGGCPLYGYSILRDDGAGGSFVEVHATDVNGKPSLNTYTVTDLPTSTSILTVKFKIKAINKAMLSVTSKPRSIVLASPPSAPLSAPYSDSLLTTSSMIKVLFNEPSDGGSPILNYEVQMDDGMGGGFTTIAGGNN